MPFSSISANLLEGCCIMLLDPNLELIKALYRKEFIVNNKFMHSSDIE
jgi:hypothetical protein